MILTEHQEEILNKAVEILKTSSRLLIKGSAGVGKTTLVNSLIEELKKQNIIKANGTIYCTAPTNKAVAVLKTKITHKNCDFITVHTALSMKRYINAETGEVYFDSKEGNSLSGISLIIVDEVSMLSTDNFNLLHERDTMIIYLGDQKQLPPVKDSYVIDSKKEGKKGASMIFESDCPTLELTEIIRQKGNSPIITLSNNHALLRKGINEHKGEEGYIFTSNLDKIITSLAEVNGTDDFKYLAWTNYEVDKINNLVRKHIYGNPHKVEIGEVIVFSTPHKDYYNNQEVTIRKLEQIDIRIDIVVNQIKEEHTFKVYIANGTKKLRFMVKDYQIGTVAEWDSSSIIMLHERDEDLFKTLVNRIKELAKNKKIAWRDYYKLIETFADFKYNHAISVHRSQGSTYKNTIINLRDIDKNRDLEEKKQLLYTAITRASDLVIIYNG